MPKMAYDAGFTRAKKLVLAAGVSIALALLTLVVVQAPSRPAYAATDRLPDLGMAHPSGLPIENTSDGR